MQLEQVTEGPIGVGTVIRRRHTERTLRNIKTLIEAEVPRTP